MIPQRDLDAPLPDRAVFVSQVDVSDLAQLIEAALPDQGRIELRRDVAGKEHPLAQHESDETLIVLEGGLHCLWEHGETLAGPGTVLICPAELAYGTIALQDGATYLIAFDHIKLPLDG